jgi:hypothetical protein
MGKQIPVIRIFITGKYPRHLLKQQNHVVAESESFIVITGISRYRTLLLKTATHTPNSTFRTSLLHQDTVVFIHL